MARWFICYPYNVPLIGAGWFVVPSFYFCFVCPARHGRGVRALVGRSTVKSILCFLSASRRREREPAYWLWSRTARAWRGRWLVLVDWSPLRTVLLSCLFPPVFCVCSLVLCVFFPPCCFVFPPPVLRCVSLPLCLV
eukprot:c20662_g1_i3.p1 GENE.c20662_g1_i3~~c20662_g1_i3.p1  ORF type:complete len:137 (+),score=8.89 c20662_g1_i3:237-647(+)